MGAFPVLNSSFSSVSTSDSSLYESRRAQLTQARLELSLLIERIQLLQRQRITESEERRQLSNATLANMVVQAVSAAERVLVLFELVRR